MCQFGTEISGSRGPNVELSQEQRSTIIFALVEDLRVSRRTIYRKLNIVLTR